MFNAKEYGTDDGLDSVRAVYRITLKNFSMSNCFIFLCCLVVFPSVIIPNGVNAISASIIITTGVGKLQFTTGTQAELDGDTADWMDWTAGDVTNADDSTTFNPVSGVRLVRTSGTVKMTVRAQ